MIYLSPAVLPPVQTYYLRILLWHEQLFKCSGKHIHNNTIYNLTMTLSSVRQGYIYGIIVPTSTISIQTRYPTWFLQIAQRGTATVMAFTIPAREPDTFIKTISPMSRAGTTGILWHLHKSGDNVYVYNILSPISEHLHHQRYSNQWNICQQSHPGHVVLQQHIPECKQYIGNHIRNKWCVCIDNASSWTAGIILLLILRPRREVQL